MQRRHLPNALAIQLLLIFIHHLQFVIVAIVPFNFLAKIVNQLLLLQRLNYCCHKFLQLSLIVFHDSSFTVEREKNQAALTEIKQKYQSEVDKVRRQRNDADAKIADLTATLEKNEVRKLRCCLWMVRRAQKHV